MIIRTLCLTCQNVVCYIQCHTEYVYLCGFAKRCPISFRLNTGVQASVAGKKPGGLLSCYTCRCQQRAQAQTYLRVGG